MLLVRSIAIPANFASMLAGCLLILTPALADASDAWCVVSDDHENGHVQLRSPTKCDRGTDRPYFVVTHGMYGTKAGDRFYVLAETIASVVPEANVVLIDWSEASTTPWLLPSIVAARIDEVADEASELLCNLGFDSAKATLIGESFGNYVNARIAKNFGEVDCILAMNPASELGGYPVPDLRRCSRVAWSFHTYSCFDTRLTLADATIFLDTQKGETALEQHTRGIVRLSQQFQHGTLLWLDSDRVLPENSRDSFRIRLTLDGQLLEADLPKNRESPDEPDSQNPHRNAAPAT